jgi:hypothetical protein
MLPDGQYSVWFKTLLAGGTGVIEIANERLSGGDTVIAYHGSFIQDGDRFTAKIATHRHSPGQPAILGIDELDIEFSGTSTANAANCVGRVIQLPHIALEVILLRIADKPDRNAC